ncbi:hypothetical protein O181_009798 [Austropuccinia psidii MF-1]|uniref:Uncharacterized protein n=1 Tax=Austropuccinia psidii MF-1 TaxID=1389203 RepID=A0A9Q3BS24_9BASI|nr:hypothetical protein [Austropuccinia psidii MF-1]
MPGEKEHAVRCGCNQSCTLDEIANTPEDVRKRTNIGKYSQFKSRGFKEKQPFRVDFKDKPKGRVAGVNKKKNSCYSLGQPTPMPITVQRRKRKSIPLNKFQRNSPKQGILSQTLWVITSENNLIKTRTQEKNS